MLTQIFVGSASAMLILAGHWFPWRKMMGRDLHRIEAYAYGVACIVGPTLIAYQLAGTSNAAAVLLSATFAAGVATLAAKAIDWAIEYSHQVQDMKDRLSHAGTLPHDPED